MPIMVGYLMHFMIGIIFAAVYVYFFNPKVYIHSKLAKGALFGFAVFVFAQVMMFIIGKIMPMPKSNDNMMLMMLGSLIWSSGIRYSCDINSSGLCNCKF